MKLTQLASAINSILQYERYPEKIDVVITTKLPYVTCGQLPCTGVRSVGMGFDWEAGQFRITPQEDLMCIRHDVPQNEQSCNDALCLDALELLKEQEAKRDYEASAEMEEYCERYEQTYNPEDGSM